VCEGVGVQAVVSTHWAEGGKGAEALARVVTEAAETGDARFAYLYDDADTIDEKIRTVATRIYGAADVAFAPQARKAIHQLTAQGHAGLPVCIAKTHLSLSHDPKLLGRPTGFCLPVRDIGVAAGAGFLYAMAGDIRTMPGLPSRPAGERVDVDAEGRTVGLF